MQLVGQIAANRKRTFLVSIAAIAAATALYLGNSWYQGRVSLRGLRECIQGKGCSGIRAVSGSKHIKADELDAIMKIPRISESAKAIADAKIIRDSSGGMTTFLIADVGNGAQAFPISMISSPDGPTYLLGSLISNVLRVSALRQDRSIETMGPLYSKLAEDMTSIVPELQKLGIKTLEVAGTQSVRVEEAAEAYRTLAEYNRDAPLKMYRP